MLHPQNCRTWPSYHSSAVSYVLHIHITEAFLYTNIQFDINEQTVTYRKRSGFLWFGTINESVEVAGFLNRFGSPLVVPDRVGS